MSKRWLCLLVSFTFFICSSVQVFAKADVNADGDDASDAGTAVTNIVIPTIPIQGVRVTVVDTLKGANTVKGSVNFLKNLGEESKRKAEGYSIYHLESSKNWKANANGEWEAGMPAYVREDRVPDDDMDKTAYVEDPEVWKRVASQLGMVYSEDASILLDPNPAENILNQKRYKLVFEPISEVKFGGKKVSIIGTTAEQMHVFQDLGGADQKSYLKNLSTYMMKSVPNSAFTKKVDKDLSVSDGTKEKGMGQGQDRSGIVLNGDGSQSVGGLGVGIISFGGKLPEDGAGKPNTGGQPVNPPAQTGAAMIKADYLNIATGYTQNVSPGDMHSPPRGNWESLLDSISQRSATYTNTKEGRFAASAGSFGTHNMWYLGTRKILNPDTSLLWSNTMRNNARPLNLNDLPTGNYNSRLSADVPNTLTVTHKPGFVDRRGEYGYWGRSYWTCFDCDGEYWDSEYLVNCYCEDGPSHIFLHKDDPDEYIKGRASARVNVAPSSYGEEQTYFEKAQQGNINSAIQKPKMRGSILTQKFTLKPQTMKVYPYYKMNYFKDGLPNPGTESAWMCATGARDITYYPEVTITVKSTEPNITAPWSRDKVDFDFNNGSTKILKAGNALSLEQKRFEVTTTLVYYENDKYYQTGSNQSLSTNKTYADVVNKLSDSFLNLHLYGNVPLTGTIEEMNFNKANLKFPNSMSQAVRAKSLFGKQLTTTKKSNGSLAAQATRSDITGSLEGKSGTTFNGSGIQAGDTATSALVGADVLNKSGAPSWYKEEYEGLIRVVLQRKVSVDSPSNQFIEAYRGISDWQDKKYQQPNAPIQYFNNRVYGGKDYVMGYGAYYDGTSISGEPIPELKVFGPPCKPFGIRGSTFDQAK